jgi:serine protease Do
MDAQYTVILNTWEEYDAQVLALDPVNDLAIISIQDNVNEFLALPISTDLENIQIWDFSIAVGNALAELQNSVSLWIVSGKNRTIQAGWDSLSWLIQTDAAINPWNSGWPLINLQWEVIWINTAIASNSNGIWFAYGLTQERINYMLRSVAESGRIMRPFIGINYIPNSAGVANQLWLWSNKWVYIIDEVDSILVGSSADKAGLEPGDIILEVNEKSLWVNITLGYIIQNSLPWDILKLKVLKKSWEEKNINLELWAI